MGFSRQEYPYTGGSQIFPVNFALGILRQEDVSVHVLGEVDGFGDQLYRTFTWVSEGEIEVTDPLPNPSTVVLDRTVSKTSLEIDLEDSGAVTRVTLNRAFKQLMMNVHEMLDGRVDSFTGAILDAMYAVRDTTLGFSNDASSSAVAASNSEALAGTHATDAGLSATTASNAATAAGNSADLAEEWATVAGRIGAYVSRAAAEAANVPTPVQVIHVLTPSGHILAYVRNTAGSVGAAITTNGGTVEWMPEATKVTPNHWAENTTEGQTLMTSAMQAAADFAGQLGGTTTYSSGGTVSFLPENYRSNTRVWIKSNGVSLVGLGGTISPRVSQASGTESTFVFSAPDGSGNFVDEDTAKDGTNIETGRVENLMFWCLAQDPSSGAAIVVDRGTRVQVKGCYIINHYVGVDLLGTGENCIISHCNISAGSNQKEVRTTINRSPSPRQTQA